MPKKSYLHCDNILEPQSPYLRFNVSKLARLLGRLREKVRAHFQHGRRVVVHGALLQLRHLGLHALLDVVLDLRGTAGGRSGWTDAMRTKTH